MDKEIGSTSLCRVDLVAPVHSTVHLRAPVNKAVPGPLFS